MSDPLATLVLIACALSCSFTVLLARLLFEPSDEPLSDDAYGDVPAIPEDFKPSFHNEGIRCE